MLRCSFVLFQFNNKCVAQVATDMLMLLCDHCGTLLKEQPDVPRRIIEVGPVLSF